MKKFITFLTILAILVMTAFASFASEPEYTLEGEKEITKRTDGASNFVSTHGGEYAILTAEIPEGKTLYSLNVKGCPTWSNKNGDSNVDIDVYKWLGDFDISMDARSLYHEEVRGHQDCDNLIITFGPTTLRYGNRYLIVFHAYDGAIGYWNASGAPKGWEFYGNLGSKLNVTPWLGVNYAIVGDLGPEPTEEPAPPITPVPATPTPDPTETPEPIETSDPTVSDTPESAEPITPDPGESPEPRKSADLLPISIYCLAASFACLGAVLLIMNRKHK